MLKVVLKEDNLKISAQELAIREKLTDPWQAVAASVNGRMCDLSTELKKGDEVIFYDFSDPEGKEVFWHSSAHILAQAVLRIWPDAIPTIGPPLEKDGFYYDFANLKVSEDDFQKIEAEIGKIIKEKLSPKREVISTREEALSKFENNPYKCELIRELDGEISAYRQGEFFDLCRGPHLHNLGKVKAFKVLKTSGAYWRADQENEMLTRIYGISFPDKAMLKEYIYLLEEAKKRDHKVLGPQLGLFTLMDEAPGIPFILPQGMIVWNRLLEVWRKMHADAGYEEIKTPQLLSRELWETSGHWLHYRENMYSFSVEDRDFALKPMNCPGGMLYYKSKRHSYREFPMRVAEFGNVYRHELSGAISGLFRVRSFHQDDAHIFMKSDQIKSEILGVLDLVKKTYSLFGLTYFFELSTKPEKAMGTDEQWEVATQGLKGALDEWGEKYQINEGDGAFYGPKIDIHIRDALGRSWQCGTIQLDMSLPEKFNLIYTDSDGSEKQPVMIHRAIFGSIERFFGILIEHFAGKFPLWLSPRQVRMMPVADKHVDRVWEVAKMFKDRGFECEVDASNEKIGKKVRNAQLDKVNYMLTVGDRELENGTVSLRTRDNVLHGEVEINAFISKIERERDDRSLNSCYTKEENHADNRN